MNPFSRLFLAVTLTCAVLFSGGCASKPVAPFPSTGTSSPDSMNNNRMGRITEEGGPTSEGLDSSGRGAGSLNGNADQQSDAYKREHGRSSPEFKPIYFDYDQSKIRGDQIPNMEHNGNYLKSNSGARVLIEGNTDNRGTNEYNLALGERRAMSAKKYLREYGIDDSRVRTVSYGEERPLFNGQSEDDYAHNRRADFILE